MSIVPIQFRFSLGSDERESLRSISMSKSDQIMEERGSIVLFIHLGAIIFE